MHRCPVRFPHQTPRKTVTPRKGFEFFVTDTRQQRWVVYFVAVEIENRQHRAVTNWIEKLVDVPRSCERARFRLAISHDGGNNQFGIIKRRTARVRQDVTQSPSLMYR